MKKNHFTVSHLLHPRLLLVSCFLSLFILFLYSACNKSGTADIQSPNSLIESARTWFVNDIVRAEKEMLSQPYSVLPSNSPMRKFARMRGLNELLNWGNSKMYIQDGIQFVITPVRQNIKPFNNKNFEAARNLVFYKDISGKWNMNIIEIISKKGGTLTGDLREIARKSFENKHLNKKNNVGNISASIIFYNQAYKHESSFESRNGIWTKAQVNLKNQYGAPKNREVPLMLGRTTCQTCQTYYLVGIWYDIQTGQIVAYEILATWDECTETGSPPDGYGTQPEPDPGQPGPSQECIDQNQAAMNDLVNSATTDNETISIDISPIDNFTKYKNPKWVILKALTWKFVSTEFGVVKLVDPTENKWQWESLVHGTIAKQGVVIGGEADIESHTGTPSFTPGTQNVLYAGMSVDFYVKYTITPIPCFPFNAIIPPVYVNYQANAIWPATP